jgi:hypothetical protein
MTEKNSEHRAVCLAGPLRPLCVFHIALHRRNRIDGLLCWPSECSTCRWGGQVNHNPGT